MIDNRDAWRKNAEAMLEGLKTYRDGQGSELCQFAVSMLTALYGAESPQLSQFRDHFAAIQKGPRVRNLDMDLFSHARAVIRNTLTELDAGLIFNLRVLVEGEMLSELVRLAREILADRTDEAKNTAAVLAAAAFEGLIRKMGEEFAHVMDRPKLEDVIGALKNADVLRGGQIGTAQSYLKFRNDSLHADWKQVDRSQVESCLAFSESLLGKHFS